MMFQVRFNMIIIAVGLWSCRAFANPDPGLMPIAKPELHHLLQNTPLESLQHSNLLSRAYASNLTKDAYAQYTVLWQKNSKDANANLWRGLAARNYWLYSSSHNEFSPGSPQALKLLQVTRSCLSKAVQLQPKSATANAEYGHFLWQWGNQPAAGLARLKKSIDLDARNSTAHTLLGDVYANPSQRTYAPEKAEAEWKEAISLDSASAYPHERLAAMYVWRKRYRDAQHELQAYLSLAPANYAQKSWVKGLQADINKGL